MSVAVCTIAPGGGRLSDWNVWTGSRDNVLMNSLLLERVICVVVKNKQTRISTFEVSIAYWFVLTSQIVVMAINTYERAKIKCQSPLYLTVTYKHMLGMCVCKIAFCF